MRVLLRIVSCLALLGTIGPPVAYAAGTMQTETMKLWMLVATVAWFAATPFWMGRPSDGAPSDAERSPLSIPESPSAADPDAGRHASPGLAP